MAEHSHLLHLFKSSPLPGGSAGAAHSANPSTHTPLTPPSSSSSAAEVDHVPPYRMAQFDKLLSQDSVDLSQLRALAWNGVPRCYRAVVWQILLGYMPQPRERRESVLKKRREEYFSTLMPLYREAMATLLANEALNLQDRQRLQQINNLGSGAVSATSPPPPPAAAAMPTSMIAYLQDHPDLLDRRSAEGETLRQIVVDLPRTAITIPLFSQLLLREMAERILYIFAVRHPACGYVQGMNDLLVPVVLVILEGYLIARQLALAAAGGQEEKLIVEINSRLANVLPMREIYSYIIPTAASSRGPPDSGVASGGIAGSKSRQHVGGGHVANSLPLGSVHGGGGGSNGNSRKMSGPATMGAMGRDPTTCDLSQLPIALLAQVEADVYWCFSKMLESIQDNYIFGQPGIQRSILRLEDLIARLDPPLHQHLQQENLLFMQFAFRWINCLLLRDLPLHGIIRLWDAYLAQEYGQFLDLHVYVCAVLMIILRAEILARGFPEVLTFLQQTLPGEVTLGWTDQEMETLLGQAYILSHLFDRAPSHLNNIPPLPSPAQSGGSNI